MNYKSMDKTLSSIERIRKALKEKGITNRQVSVKNRGGSSLNDMIYITQKDLTINKYWLEDLAKQNEHIRWDDYAQEILSGCNTFIDYSIDSDILNNYIKENGLLEKANEYIKEVENGNGSGIVLNDERFILFKDCFYIESKEDNRRLNVYPQYIAKYLAYYKLGYYEPYETWKKRKDEEERKAKEEYEKRQEEAKKQQAIYKKEREKAQELFKSDLEIIEIEEENQTIATYRWAHLNKNNTLKEYKDLCNNDYDFYRQKGKTTHILKVNSYEALDALNHNLLTSIEQIKGKGGTYQDNDGKYINLVIAVMFKDKLQYVIDPQGYSYARYVGLS
jgi:hypothetical protein